VQNIGTEGLLRPYTEHFIHAAKLFGEVEEAYFLWLLLPLYVLYFIAYFSSILCFQQQGNERTLFLLTLIPNYQIFNLHLAFLLFTQVM
jgi:hypothetical protein